MKNMRRKFFIIIITLFALLLLSCTYSRYFASTDEVALPATQWQRFLQAYAIIKKYYVKEVSDETLINNAINGMLQGLDNYSLYLDSSDLNYLKQLTTGNFTGIGVEVLPDDGALKVITPLDNSPAKRAGLLPGDEIIEVNGQPLDNLTFQEALEAMRGPVGSKVEITLVRAKVMQPITVAIRREKLHSQNVRSRLVAKNIGYIRIGLFQETTATEVKRAVTQLVKTNHASLQGMVLDLRYNPGGLLDSAAAVSDLFLDKHSLGNNLLIVYSKDRAGQTIFQANADGEDILHHIPMVILINQGSASGAEIVAAALHDHHRAILVGEKTFGKGSVQTVIPLNNDDAIKMTTALYYTPSGKLIDHIGVPPDVVIAADSSRQATDNQLTQVLVILQKQISQANLT